MLRKLALLMLLSAPAAALTPPAAVPSWHARQAIGPPDAQPGDHANAWASQAADGGQEWLLLHYDQAVAAREVRIHENHNPGAVAKVTAVDDQGQETELWVGVAPAKPEPHVFTVTVPPVKTRRLKIYLDTARIPGWNEIDAVELVGIDGKRQWAVDARASTSYGASSNVAAPLAELIGRKVRIGLAGRTVEGTLEGVEGDFLRVEQFGKPSLVSRAAIQTIEW